MPPLDGEQWWRDEFGGGPVRLHCTAAVATPPPRGRPPQVTAPAREP
ncbi:hypothetical protein ACTWPP_04335 [Actinomadura sp. 3N407]